MARIHDTRVQKREDMEALDDSLERQDSKVFGYSGSVKVGRAGRGEEDWELEVNALRSQICVLKERQCMAENNYTTAKVQIQALQSQLETYRELGFSTIAPSLPPPKAFVQSPPKPPPNPQAQAALERLRAQVKEKEHVLEEKEHVLKSLERTNAETVKKLENQLAHLQSQHGEKEAYQQVYTVIFTHVHDWARLNCTRTQNSKGVFSDLDDNAPGHVGANACKPSRAVRAVRAIARYTQEKCGKREGRCNSVCLLGCGNKNVTFL
jgi:DNA repair exonuclease SbcCD ATPase subunit